MMEFDFFDGEKFCLLSWRKLLVLLIVFGVVGVVIYFIKVGEKIYNDFSELINGFFCKIR